MTPEELEADRIATLRADPRTPAIVRRAFLRPSALTLRKFLALEDAASPILHGAWPFEDSAAMGNAFCTTHAIIFPDRAIPGPDRLIETISELTAQVEQGFSTVMPMRFPRQPGERPAMEPQDGIGWVARLLARMGVIHLDTPLDQLFIIAAASSANEGAESFGEDYKERLVSAFPVSTEKLNPQAHV